MTIVAYQKVNAISVAVAEVSVGLAIEIPDAAPAVSQLTPKEAHRLANRIHKAANDASAAAARKRSASV